MTGTNSANFDANYDVVQEHYQRYLRALKAMQTGVAYMMNYPDRHETDPKHLRVGVNSSMVNSSALADLLMKKGIITGEEWYSQLADCMEAEANTYQREITKRIGTGADVTLH